MELFSKKMFLMLLMLFCFLQIEQINAVNNGTCSPEVIKICIKAKPEDVCETDSDCKITEKCCQTGCVAKLCMAAYFPDQGNSSMKVNNKTEVYQPVHMKEEQTAKKGKSYTIDCTVAPDKKDVSIVWKAGDDIVKDKDNKYSFAVDDTPKRKSLVIKEVEFSDRREFMCISSYKNFTSTLKVRLRVRDPLGAVWPLIGILIGSCLLFLIIFIHECRTRKGEKTGGSGENDDKQNLVET